MMGLTDRVEPWARRFQRAPAPADEREEPHPPAARADDEALAAPAPPPRDTGRFTRRLLQEREA